MTDLAASGTFGATLVHNEPDEEAAAPTTGGTATTQDPGSTLLPDLTAVTLVLGTDPFGNTGTYLARYTFDRALTSVASAGEFQLYLADGTRLVATSCTLGASATTTPSNSQVDCNAFTGVTAATSAQIGSAVLGTVDNGAVNSAAGSNPEGGAVTTGGTGTPAA